MKNHILHILAAALLVLSSCADKHPAGTATITKGKLTYRGEVRDNLYNGYGTLTCGDSLIYSGQWKDGKKHGRGTATDPEGHKVYGRWNNDSIISGTITRNSGIYKGELDSLYRPDGHGIYTGNDGSYYDGNWEKGVKSRFGCYVTARGKVQTGEWKNNKYRGERLTYTTERIYGIDISRYQHGKGKKTYPIHWDRLRITDLGKISRKKVSGRVDYPVSFVYIKSTEGTTIRNPYYHADYRQARKHGIKCGAYHFFSCKSPAIKQARYFLKNSRFGKGDFPPVLDVEPSEAQIRRMGGDEELFKQVRIWLETVKKHTGVSPILYISQQFVNKHLPSAPDIMRDYRVWIARYGEYKPDVRLIFWQLCPDGRVKGIRGEVDINIFNGYKDQYDNFLITELIQ